METKSGLYFGKDIDFKKIMNIMKDFDTDNNASYEIIIDCKEFDPRIQLDFDCVGAEIKEEDFNRLHAEITKLSGHFVWCTNNHWHPSVVVNDVRYEAYAKKSVNGDELFILREEYGIKKEVELKDSLMLKLCNLPERMQWLTIKQEDSSTYIDESIALKRWIEELLRY